MSYEYKEMFANLQMDLVPILLPVVRAVHAQRPIRSVQAYALRRIQAPSAHIQLARALVRQDETRRAEHIRPDVHRAPRMLEIVDERDVELVRARGVVELGSAEFLDHRDLVVDAESDHQRNDHAADQVLSVIEVSRARFGGEGIFTS